MNTRLSVLITAVSSFAGGFLLGLLIAPETGRQSRQRIARAAHGSTRWMEDRLHDIEEQLHEVEKQVQETGQHLGERVRSATQNTLGHYMPSVPDEGEWDIEREDVSHNLRRMPRR